MRDPRYSHCCPYAGPWLKLYFLPETTGTRIVSPDLGSCWFTDEYVQRQNCFPCNEGWP